MALLHTSYNTENTVKKEIRSVEQTSVSMTHRIIKSTDSDLPAGLSFADSAGELISGVWEVDGIKHAMVLIFISTLEEAIANKLNQFEQSAKSEIGAISVLDDDFAEQRQAIKDKLTAKNSEINIVTTLQDTENVVW